MKKRITKIEIKNYKGISNLHIDFDELYANKLNLFVAPNGFGKSSLAACFNNLKRGKLHLPEELCHNDDNTLSPYLCIESDYDGTVERLEADLTKNDITKTFEIAVINSKIRSKTRQGFGLAKATSHIDYETLILLKNVPKKIDLNYKKSEQNHFFQKNKSSVIDIEKLLPQSESFMLALFHYSGIEKFFQAKNAKFLDAITTKLQQDRLQIKVDEIEKDIKSNAAFSVLLDLFKSSFTLDNEIEYLITLAQTLNTLKNDKKLFLDWLEYKLYCGWKDRISDTIKKLNTTKYNSFTLTATQGNLSFSLDNFNKLSNGQRDSLSFLAQLYRAEYELIFQSKKNRSILLIDEIFDYLD